jgi:hypothetical protein
VCTNRQTADMNAISDEDNGAGSCASLVVVARPWSLAHGLLVSATPAVSAQLSTLTRSNSLQSAAPLHAAITRSDLLPFPLLHAKQPIGEEHPELPPSPVHHRPRPAYGAGAPPCPPLQPGGRKRSEPPQIDAISADSASANGQRFPSARHTTYLITDFQFFLPPDVPRSYRKLIVKIFAVCIHM